MASVLGGLAVAVLLCAPLFVVHLYRSSIGGAEGPTSEEVTVGIAVILRATARRFLRTASNSLMRTAFSVVGRASARAATRRVVKAATKVTIGMALQRNEDDDDAPEPERRPQSALIALASGALALGLSFWGILEISSAEVADKLLYEGRLGVTYACIYVAVPLLAYAACHRIFGQLFGVRISYRTDVEGLLLQGYFTGSGSFLPMTTDVEYDGSQRASCLVATSSLLAMLLLHLGCMWAAHGSGSEHLEFLGAAFLVYAFIYVFPITPLEGTFIWRSSKLLWLLVAAPILAAFLYLLPASFGEIL
ncbi:MAG: hypothetical protein KDC98_20865 [Planctomycetes bacterium]|nr:hypothetical protein [Planctomycetota bacterium]